MASHIVDRSQMLERMWDAHEAGHALTKSLLSPADEGATLGSPGNARDPRHAAPAAIIPPPLHLAPPPRSRHPRDARILPKSRDFH
jgi:hypothetical protein